MPRDAALSTFGGARAWLRASLARVWIQGRVGQALRRSAQLGTFLWLLDASFTLAAGTPPTAARAWGWVASLGTGVLALAPIVLVLHWLLASSFEAVFERIAEWFAPRVSAAERHRVGSIIAVLVGIALVAPVAFAITRSAILEIAQPHFGAMTIVAVHGVLFALALAAWPALQRACVALTAFLARTPVGIPLRSAGRFVLLLASLALLGVLALAFMFFGTVRLLPWHVVGSVAGALALTFAAELLARVLPRALRVAGTGLLTALVIAAVAAAIALDRAPDSARGAMRESLDGQIGQEVLALGLDFDRDGYLGMLGGGDCAPFDSKRHPGAIDVPDNRRDEDCDGRDLTRSAILQSPRHDWPVPPELPRRPPVILITVDAFAARHMRSLAEDPARARDVTPQLDAFARSSTLFRSCFAQGPSTRLSFPSIFTSRWDSQIEQKLVTRHPFPIEASEVLLAEVMKEAGYDTAAVLAEAYFTPKKWGSLLQGFDTTIDTPVRLGMGGRHNSRAITDAAIAKIKANALPPSKTTKPQKPLFLWAHYFDAHPPHVKPQQGVSYGNTQADIYDAELHLVDAEVGRLLREIRKTYGEQALVIITGDHGIGFDSPRHRRLTYGYDLSSVVLQVPLIVHGPQVKPQVLDGLVSTMDIAPTIANLLRIRKKLPFEGASLVPELLEGRVTRPQRLIHEFFLEERLWKEQDPLAMISLRTERYNLIHNRLTGVLELYDYRADYLETHDLIDEPAHAQALATLKQHLALFTYELHKPKPKPGPDFEAHAAP